MLIATCKHFCIFTFFVIIAVSWKIPGTLFALFSHHDIFMFNFLVRQSLAGVVIKSVCSSSKGTNIRFVLGRILVDLITVVYSLPAVEVNLSDNTVARN